MNKLHDMPNISSLIEAELINAGIKTQEELIDVGSKKAFKEIYKKDKRACLNMLCALEGAVQGIRWYNLSSEMKKELKQFYDSLMK